MDELSIGVLAHVDAGKTTLSESLLFTSKKISSMGRVDHQSTYLDYDVQERQRGITIYSKQARFEYHQQIFNLLDTPGHGDFSVEMERVLNVLDVAILVINAHSLVQSQTKVIFNLLSYYQVPTFIFVNKMDSTHYDKDTILTNIQNQLSVNCLDFTHLNAELMETLALNEEDLLNQYLETSMLSDLQIASLIQQRKCFPCIFGSALNNDSVDQLLDYLCRFKPTISYSSHFEAYVYKVTREHHQRWLHLKVLGGSLKVKSKVEEEKIDQIRLYSGVKYEMVEEVLAGQICSVKGLNHIQAGQYIGINKPKHSLILHPVMEYQLIGHQIDPVLLYKKLVELNDEDPSLNLTIDEQQQIHISLMGEVQQEILQRKISELYQIEVSFKPLDVLYYETVSKVAEGVGHYEPMGHYAEVHVLLSPNELNTGMTYENRCQNESSRVAQEQLMRYMKTLRIKGVIKGAEVSDVHIQLLSVDTNLKHTQPIDLKEALYRAIRQGLMKAECVLLEPLYRFSISVLPQDLSRVIFELDQRGANYEINQLETQVKINGQAPVRKMMDFTRLLQQLSKEESSLSLSLNGFEKVNINEEIYNTITYDPLSDLQHPTGSMFFKQGKGFYVAWDEVENYMHTSYQYKPIEPIKSSISIKHRVSDEELTRVMNNTYKPKERVISQKVGFDADQLYQQRIQSFQKPVYMLVDGYNLIFSFNDLKEIANHQIEAARNQLLHLLSSYQAIKNCHLLVVFDAYKQDHVDHQLLKNERIDILFTKTNVSADQYIQQKAKELEKDYQVIVVTSDRLIQLSVLSANAKRISSRLFEVELNRLIEKELEQYQKAHPKQANRPLKELKEIIK